MSESRSPDKRAPRSDGAATRARILQVSGEMFAAAGLADTSNKDIAARAGVNPATLNFHFVNRAGLYQAVLAEAHRRIADRTDLERIVGSDRSARERLRDLLGFLIGGAARKLDWPIILLGREVLAPTSHFATLQEEEILPKLQIVLPLLGEISGLPADDPALFRCLPSIAAPCAFVALVGRGETPMAERLGHAPTEEIVDQMLAYAVGGLEAVGRWHRER
ncbi:TetR/AcrR family transcriptional regulator [Albibacillus kandeliae]|uniref:TetR/AcrR family transcriptional regulator n=1 Tax=Albibacillus kandeliae TaxID=2174228 RepID=UPI0018E53D3B|nr:TetR/AcrR family transcriptional regulator [Albibacillus kandeliae]